MIKYDSIAAGDILNFMSENMKTLESGQTTIASIPVARFNSSFPIDGIITDSYEYVSMAVTRGVVPEEEMDGLYQNCNHMLIAVFEDDIRAYPETARPGDVLLMKRYEQFRPKENTLWGFVPFGYAIHLNN